MAIVAKPNIPIFNYGVFIGRFQPFHRGHEHVVRESLKHVDHLIIVIGSTGQAPNVRNPFTFEERRAMILASFMKDKEETVSVSRISFVSVGDNPYSDDAWLSDVQRAVHKAILDDINQGSFHASGMLGKTIALCGYTKDGSTYYLRKFPQWNSVNIHPHHIKGGPVVLSSTDIRRMLLTKFSLPMFQVIQPPASLVNGLTSILSDGVADYIIQWVCSNTETFKQLQHEWSWYEGYKKEWGEGPFLTADAVCVQSGHILLVTRGAAPGKGLLALPGGFVNLQEKIRDAAIRELKEETEISDGRGHLPPGVLGSFIDDSRTRVFDYPWRDPRGRVVTTAYLFDLPDKKPLYRVVGSDDAQHAQWYPIGQLEPKQLFADHFQIIQTMLGL